MDGKIIDFFVLCETVEFMGCSIVSAACDGSGAVLERSDGKEIIIRRGGDGGEILAPELSRRDFLILRGIAAGAGYRLIDGLEG
jgi:hypothetical protein